MHDAFVLILWTDDSQTLETLHYSPCHSEYLYQCIFLGAFTMLCVLTQNALEILLESMHNFCLCCYSGFSFLFHLINAFLPNNNTEFFKCLVSDAFVLVFFKGILSNKLKSLLF